MYPSMLGSELFDLPSYSMFVCSNVISLYEYMYGTPYAVSVCAVQIPILVL